MKKLILILTLCFIGMSYAQNTDKAPRKLSEQDILYNLFENTQQVLRTKQISGTVDTNNSTTSTLDIDSVLTLDSINVSSYSSLTVIAIASDTSASYGLKLQFSIGDGVWYDTDSATVNLSPVILYSVIKGKYFRIQYTNGDDSLETLGIQTLLFASPNTVNIVAGSPLEITGTVTSTPPDSQLVYASHPIPITGSVTVTPPDSQLVHITHPLSVTGTFWQATQPVSGTVAATQSGTWNVTDISGTVSLPTGASTAANQSTIITRTDSIDAVLGRLETALETVRSKQDSLQLYTEATVVRFVNDTTSNGNDSYSIIGAFSKYVWITITADDSIEFSFDASFGAGLVGKLTPNATSTPESYTYPIAIDVVTYPTLYYRRFVISGGTGTPNVRINMVGK